MEGKFGLGRGIGVAAEEDKWRVSCIVFVYMLAVVGGGVFSRGGGVGLRQLWRQDEANKMEPKRLRIIKPVATTPSLKAVPEFIAKKPFFGGDHRRERLGQQSTKSTPWTAVSYSAYLKAQPTEKAQSTNERRRFDLSLYCGDLSLYISRQPLSTPKSLDSCNNSLRPISLIQQRDTEELKKAMACSAATSMAALLSSNPNPKACVSSKKSLSSSQSAISLASSFSGKPLVSRVPRSLSSRVSSAKRRSFVVRASELPLVGNVAPDFEAEAVFDQEFINVKLSDYIGKKYVILFFYPLDFTFVCPTEITAFSDRYQEFEKLNTEVLGVSIDSVFSHLAWVQTDRKSGGLGDLAYPLVSDVTKSIAKSYGVLIPDQGIALRGLFIIDKEGVIQHSTINNLAIGRSVDETLRTLQALQYVQDNPDEVCPAGWKPGEKSMKPDPKGSKEYFAAI
ncbi:hypothetical protein RD792_014362 [Penstemon davidsonii]|uniref:thioredoxin-dependent peroxiredoxin n=1 Tax=Penstemon davidsonii TaxID=160366 RepID=A0ABR0CP39_9LAMI|nr:hypothetical protein RD792_014362 [Penstemon davidsonii]